MDQHRSPLKVPPPRKRSRRRSLLSGGGLIGTDPHAAEVSLLVLSQDVQGVCKNHQVVEHLPGLYLISVASRGFHAKKPNSRPNR
jgi:hypothetical protein